MNFLDIFSTIFIIFFTIFIFLLIAFVCAIPFISSIQEQKFCSDLGSLGYEVEIEKGLVDGWFNECKVMVNGIGIDVTTSNFSDFVLNKMVGGLK